MIKSYKILKIKYGFGLTYNIFGFENQKNKPKLSIEVERALPESKKINILTFRGISDFAVSDSTLPKQFESNINGKKSIRILLLSPDSPIAEKRAKEIGESLMTFRNGIYMSLGKLDEIARTNSNTVEMEIRLFSEKPAWKLYIFDELLLMQFYFENVDSNLSPMYKFKKAKFPELFKSFELYYDTLWVKSIASSELFSFGEENILKALRLLCETKIDNDLMHHSFIATAKACEMVASYYRQKSNQYIDVELVKVATLHHSIGKIFYADERRLVKGYNLIMSQNILFKDDERKAIARAVLLHRNGGLSKNDREKINSSLPIEERIESADYFPVTIEEKIISYATLRTFGRDIIPYKDCLSYKERELCGNPEAIKRIEKLHDEVGSYFSN